MKKTACSYAFACAFIFYSIALHAQPTTVSGKVFNTTNQTLEGVSVHVKNSAATARTAGDGSFSIKAAATDSLVFSSLIRWGVFNKGTWWDKQPDADDHTQIFPIGQNVLNASKALKQNPGY